MAISPRLPPAGGISPLPIGREIVAAAAKLRNLMERDFAVVKLNFMICKLELGESLN